MSRESEVIAKGKHMPSKESWLSRIFPTLITILISSGIGFNVYLTKSLNDLNQRVKPLEEWKVDHTKFATDCLVKIAEERDKADEATREKVLREVERAAAIQREGILSQLASIQRDVLRIAVILDLRGSGAAYTPSNGSPRKDSDKIADTLAK